MLSYLRPILDLPHRHRRIWHNDERAHIELRELDAEATAQFADDLVTRVQKIPGVEWAEVLGRPGRLVVRSPRDERILEQVLATIETVESESGASTAPLGVDRPDHPADIEPIVRTVVALGADTLGLFLAGVGRARRWRPLPVEIDTAALLAVLENVPAARKRVEHRLTTPVAELGLAAANGIVSGLAQGAMGPLVDIGHRVSLLGEAEARRRAWERREPELCATPGNHRVRSLLPVERPAPLADGPVEQYSTKALPASLGGFGVGLLATRSLDRAAAALLAGLPKAARLGREAFAAQAGRAFAARDMVVLDPMVLRRLDRIDRLILVDAALRAGGDIDGRAEEAVRLAKRAGLTVTLATDDPGLVQAVDPDAVLPDDRAHVTAAVRDLQLEHHGVMVVATGDHPGLEDADCGVGLRLPGEPPPWGAAIMGGDDLADAALVIEACGLAREVSRQSANLAFFGASAGVFLAFGGLVPGTTRRVASAINASAVIAMANGARAGVALTTDRLVGVRLVVPWHNLDAEEVMVRLETSLSGLSEDGAALRRVAPPREELGAIRFGRIVLDELFNPLTPVLAVGAGLSLAVGSVGDAVLVCSVVGLNALLGGVQRYQTEEAISALTRQEAREIVVIRGGARRQIPSAELVPGDLLAIESGDIVPADCRVIESHGLQADESSLTGESVPVGKQSKRIDAPNVAERSSMLYDGTSVASGRGLAVVVAVGDGTEGRSGGTGESAPPTGVEMRLSSITTRMTPLSIGAGLGVLGAGLLRGRPLQQTAGAGVSLAVAAVPEGLPLLSTAAQMSAARRLSTRGALVRNPRAIEALGRVDSLCVDKTGTLTEGRIRVAVVAGRDGEPHDLDELDAPSEDVLRVALRATPAVEGERKLPHPTDRALAHASRDTGITAGDGAPGWRRRSELPFEPSRGFHATVATSDGLALLSVKGAPEVLLPRCTNLDATGRASLVEAVEAMAGTGLRVLAVAERSLDDWQHRRSLRDTDVDELSFVGVIGLADPIRPTAAAAVANVRRAGVEVIMITGDHPATAEGVARELDLVNGNAVLTGAEIDELDDAELRARMSSTSVCARVTPVQKVRIVRALQHGGRAVAMTGDGSNDAPAIRLADVGIALGTRATTAARSAADVVVIDDRIETIVDAIGEGRTMWASVRDAVAILVGGNLGEIAFTLGGSLLTGSPPLNARQLLLVNLMTDIAPALAIAVRPPVDSTVESLLREGPDRSLGPALNRAIAVRAACTASGAASAWGLARLTGTAAHASSVGLLALVGAQLGQTLITGGRSPAVLAAGLGSAVILAGIVQTPGVSHAFGCRPLGPWGWTVALVGCTAASAGSIVLPKVIDHLPGDWLDRADRAVLGELTSAPSASV